MTEYTYSLRVYGSAEIDDDVTEPDDLTEMSDELAEAILEDMADGFTGGHDMFVYRESGEDTGIVTEKESF